MIKSLDRRLFKENLLVFLQVFIIVIGLILASFYFFNAFLEKQIEAKKNYLSNQAEVCGFNLEQEISKFKTDFHHFITDREASDLLGEKMNASLKIRLKKFLEYNNNLIDTLIISDSNVLKMIWISNEQFLRYQVYYDTSVVIGDSLEVGEFHFDKERDLLSISNGKIHYQLVINQKKFIESEFSKFFIGNRAIKQIYSASNGLQNVQVPDYINAEFSLFGNHEIEEISQRLKDGLKGEFLFKMNESGFSDKLLMAMYPVDVIGEQYAILFSIPVDEIESEFFQSFQNILIISIGVILLVVLLFSLNIFRIKSASEELEDNKQKLTALVRQQKLLLEYSNDFTYRFDAKGVYDYVSENVKKVLGFTPEEFCNPNFRKFTSNPLNKVADETSRKILTGESESKLFYLEILDYNNEAKVLEVKEKAIKNDRGEIEGVIGIAKDITEKFNSDLKFRVLFEYSSEPHLIYDSNGIIDCNEATIRLLGLKSKKEILQKKPAEFSPEEQPNGEKSIFLAEEMDAEVMEKGSNRFEWVFEKSNGEIFPVEISLTKVNISHKQVVLGVWYDLTERKKVEEALIMAKKKAEDLASQKQQFLSAMSHEIRTPLNAVIGYTHLLLDENPLPKQIDKLKSLQFSADNLLSLVNDILDHSKIESGKIEFAKTPFKIRERLIGIREMFDIKARKKNLQLSLEVDQSLPEKVVGDPVRLNQILINLVGNAIKFTNKGEVVIYANVKAENENTVDIQFKVRDTGIGISEEKQKIIFDTFVQADSRILNEYGGTGLGLSISKNLVEFQKGKLEVESEPGKGSVFSFYIRFTKYVQHVPKKVKEGEKAEKPLDKAKVLLVEDNLINQKIASQFLSKWGADVTIAADGRKGLDKIQEEKFDFVLMDLQMPVMDGYESTQAIRALSEDYYKNIPIITLTADAFVEVKERTQAAGMNDYVTKPINPVEFLKVLKKYYSV